MPNLKIAAIVSTSFNLWMFHGNVDTFALVIIFLNEILGVDACYCGIV